MEEKKYESRALGTLILAEPTFKGMKTLKELGFDLKNPDSITSTWINIVQDPEMMEKLTRTIFIVDSVDAALAEEIEVKIVKQGLVDYMGESGILISF